MRVIRENPIGTWGQRAYEEDIVQGRFFGRSSFILNTPDAIRHVLVDNYENYTRTPAGLRVLRPMLGEGLLIAEGRAWKHQRRTLAPAFTPRAVATLVPHMIAATDETIAEARRRSARPVDLREVMQRMTLEIAGRTMFSFGMERTARHLRDFVMEYGERLGAAAFSRSAAAAVAGRRPQDFARARFRKRWTRFVAMLMAERRAAGKNDGAPPRDLFDLMDAARDPETGQGVYRRAARRRGRDHDPRRPRDHRAPRCSGRCICWRSIPPTQEQVAAEVTGASIVNGALEIERLKFTRAVVDETMRLYPPAFLIARAARRAGHHRGHAGQEERRDPDRALAVAPARKALARSERVHAVSASCPAPPPDRFAYLPFGVGARVCIGAHFALVEATLALAKMIGAFRVELVDKAPVMPIGVVTTQPDRSPMFVITPR